MAPASTSATPRATVGREIPAADAPRPDPTAAQGDCLRTQQQAALRSSSNVSGFDVREMRGDSYSVADGTVSAAVLLLPVSDCMVHRPADDDVWNDDPVTNFAWWVVSCFFAALAGVFVGLGAHLALLGSGVLLVLTIVTIRDQGFVLALIGLGLSTMNGVRVGPVSPADFFLLPAAAIAIVLLILRSERLPTWWIVSVSGLVFVGSASIVVSSPRSLILLLQFIGLTVAVPLMLAAYATSPRRRRLLVVAFVSSAVLNAGMAILDASNISDVARLLTGFEGVGGRVTGLSNHPNLLGLSCGMAAPFALYLARSNRPWSLAVPILALGCLVSGSRSGLLAFAISILLVSMLGRQPTRRLLGVIILAGTTLYVALRLGYASAFERLVNFSPTTLISDAERAGKAARALQDISAHPYAGVGFTGDEDAHSLYLEISRSGGLIALVFYLVMVLGGVFAGWRRRSDELLGASTASLAAFLVVAVQHNTLTERFVFVPLGFLLAGGLKPRKIDAFIVSPSKGRSTVSVGPAFEGSSNSRGK